MEVIVYNSKGEDTGKKVTLPEDVFGIQPNQHAIYLDVKQYLANQRQGTHKAKERAENAHSTRKLKKQKGRAVPVPVAPNRRYELGVARFSDPRPRDYSFKLNKKVKSLARRSALAVKAQASKISVIDNITLEAPRTKDYIQFLNDMNLTGRKTLLILPDVNMNVVLSSRNVQKTKVTTASQVNTYDLMNADQLLISEEALSTIQTIFDK